MDGTIPPRRGPGQPPHVPSEERRQHVAVLRANGVPVRIIAEMLGISHQTLRTHYKPELRNGFEKVKAAIGVSLVRAAIGGNMHAAKFWLQTRGGPEWRIIEGREINMPAPGEEPPELIFTVPRLGADGRAMIDRDEEEPL
jgi:Homeodomain-like domain